MTYMIEAPHSPDQCLQAMDEVLSEGPRLLGQFEWGCVEGQHTGWATVEAGSESEARNMVPAIARSQARIIWVDKVTPDQVNAMRYLPPEPEGPADTPDPFEAVLVGPAEESAEDI